MNASRSPSGHRGFWLAALVAAVICVLALAAGAFVLSYTGVRDTALSAGVTAHLARLYPGILDAVLVVACVAALSLRGAPRAYAWLAILVIIAAAAAADAAHATSAALPRRAMEATVAITPWAVLLIGFTLLYAIARQAWPGREAAATAYAAVNGRMPAEQATPAAGPGTGSATVPLSSLLAGKPATRPEPAQAALAARATAPAARTEPASKPGTTATVEPAGKAEPLAVRHPTVPAKTATELEPLPARRPTGRDEPSDADAEPAEPTAHFSRLRSGPTPPQTRPSHAPPGDGPSTD